MRPVVNGVKVALYPNQIPSLPDGFKLVRESKYPATVTRGRVRYLVAFNPNRLVRIIRTEGHCTWADFEHPINL